MKFGSVASGIEGASAAWDALGWECVFASEIDPFPCEVLKYRFPHVPNLGDMTNFKEWPDANLDVLVGGTPCQSFSVAGLRKGLDDPRGDLTLTFAAIAARYRPRWLVWENVPGLLSSSGGRDFAAFLGLLTGTVVEVPPGGWQTAGFVAGIPDAYGVAYRVLDAQYCGVPQRRRRIILVGYSGDYRPAAAVLLELASLRGDPAPRRSPREGVARSLAGGAAERSGSGDSGAVSETVGALTNGASDGLGWRCGPDEAAAGHAIPTTVPALTDVPVVSQCLNAGGHHGGKRTDPETETLIPAVANCLTRRMHKGVNTTFDEGQTMIPVVARTLDVHGRAASEDGTGRGAILIPVAFKASHYTRDKDGAPSEVTPPLYSGADAGGQVAVFVSDISPTLRAGGNQTGGDRPPGTDVDTVETLTAFNVYPSSGQGSQLEASQTDVASSLTAVRRLTPRECERLQGFPDDWTAIPMGKRGHVAKDGPRYKALGNSFAVPMFVWVGERIQMVTDVLRESGLR
jgi:DNA (cytosine-5)-methyltransferase 1